MDPNISVAVALGAFFVWALLIWHRLVRLRAEVSAALANLDSEAQRLRDLVTGLEQTARAHLGHERETLDAVTAAREAAQAAAATAPDAFADAPSLSARAGSQDQLSSALNRLLAAAEAHPALKDDPSLQRLARELNIGEDRLSGARRSYDQAVATYNAALQAFPAVMFAGMLGFRPAAPLE